MIDRETLAREYQRMSDEQLRHFAMYELQGLRPEALEIFREVARRRGTVPDIEAAFEIEKRGLSPDEFDLLVSRFRKEPCPHCGGRETPLNAVVVMRARIPELVAGCIPCLKERLRALTMLSSMASNDQQVGVLDGGGQTEALRQYVWLHRGELAHLLPQAKRRP